MPLSATRRQFALNPHRTPDSARCRLRFEGWYGNYRPSYVR